MQAYDDIVEKWLFGDIEPENFEAFALSMIDYTQNANVLLSLVNEEKPDAEDLNRYFRLCLKEIDIDLPKQFSNDERMTYILAKIDKPFEKIVFSVSDEDIYYIASLDYGNYIEEYADAIRQIIFKQHGIFNVSKTGFAKEVISLGQYNVKKNHEKAFAICNCLLAKNFVLDNCWLDVESKLDDSESFSEFEKLPFEIRVPVLECWHIVYRFEKLKNKKPYLFSVL